MSGRNFQAARSRRRSTDRGTTSHRSHPGMMAPLMPRREPRPPQISKENLRKMLADAVANTAKAGG